MTKTQREKWGGPSYVNAWCETQALPHVLVDSLLDNAATAINSSWKIDTKVTTGSDSITVRAESPTIYSDMLDYCKDELNRRPTMKNENKISKPKFVDVKRIIHSGPCTIVFWEDNTKTVVRCSENDIYDEYSAFCSALAIKLYGTNSHLKKVIERVSK